MIPGLAEAMLVIVAVQLFPGPNLMAVAATAMGAGPVLVGLRNARS